MSVAQKNLEGKRVQMEVQKEEKTTVSYTFWHGHFFLRITASALDKIQDLEDPAKRREKMIRRVKARPDAEEIPSGAKAKESKELVASALHEYPISP
jgi:hypothetical protein